MAGEILVTDTVAPAELAQLQRTRRGRRSSPPQGSPLSHSAILARSLHLPLVVGAHAGAAAHQRRRRAASWMGASRPQWWSNRTRPTCARSPRAPARERQRERANPGRLRSRAQPHPDGIDIAPVGQCRIARRT
ncbi:MAG: PEP-utilizing enzyme [Chiayiivirga sp.]|nr:PEP-utilizing enzyme [Chiayiivirga sp.]